ncbi:MAG: DUF6259 domain-containing protein [Lentisphaeria bacterium]|jgi:hypothetical protein|nr:DUF6259 domain-containing protein [Lentisphaeria bacterium]
MRRQLVTLCCLAVGAGVGAQNLVLENGALRLELGRSPGLHVARLIHRASGTVVLAEGEARSLFTIVLRKADGSTENLSSLQAGTSEATVETEDGNSVAVLRFRDFPDTALRAEVRIAVGEADPLILWTIRVDNPDRRAIALVRFPLVRAVPQLGETGTDDVLVLPCLPGALARDPGTNWKLNEGMQLRYPGDLSAQFLAYQDAFAGLFFSVRDAGNHPRRLSVWKRETGFEFSHEYEVNGASPETWSAPYPAALGVTQGTWHESADLYKRWAVQQPWCARPLAERDDIPAWWKQGPVVHVCAVRTFGADRVQTGSYYPKLLDHLRFLREKVDGPVVAMLASWEKNRRWSGGDYFPVFDHEQAQTVIAKMKAEGFRPFFFLSGLYFTFDNIGVNGGPVPAAAEHLDSYVIDDKGKTAEYTLNESRKPVEWKRLSYDICPATPYAREFCRQIIDDSRELGVDILQMDQTVSGGGHPCYSSNHGHEPGIGPYQARTFHALLADMREYGKAKNPDFVLFHEEPHEELIPYLDGFHMREYKEKWWYRAKPGVVGIPLFTYLYHEYAIGYGGDNAQIGPRNEVWNTRCHAVNLVSGKTPGVSVWSSPSQLFESHPAPLAMIRHHCQLFKTRAVEHLMLGTMLHPLVPEVPMQNYRVWTTTGGTGRAEDFAEPAILTSSWQAPDGSIGHLFVNPTMVPQNLNVEIDTRNRPAAGPCNVAVYTSETAAFAPLWQQVRLPQPYTAELPPQGVVFLLVESGK